MSPAEIVLMLCLQVIVGGAVIWWNERRQDRIDERRAEAYRLRAVERAEELRAARERRR